MNNKLNIFIIGILIISFYAQAVSAAVVLTSYWEGNGGDYVEIEKGDSEEFYVSVSSTTYHINYEIELYQGSQLIDTLYEGSHTGYFYNHYFDLDSSNLEVGNYKLRIRVNDGGQGYDWHDLYFEVYEEIVEENHAPEAPFNPNPLHFAEDIELNIILAWDAYDVDGDDLTFDVYFKEEGESYDLIANDIAQEYVSVSGLDYETNYYWKVVVSDGEYSTSGPVWTFETEEEEIIEENHAPVIDEIGNKKVKCGRRFTLDVDAYDADGDDLKYYDNSDLFEIDEDNGEISFRTDCDDRGSYNIRITVEDEHGARDYEYFTLRIYKDSCDEDEDDNGPQFHEFVETSQCVDDGNGDKYGIRKIMYSVVDLVSGQEYSNETREEACLLSFENQIYKNDTRGLVMLFAALLFLLITIPIVFFIFKKLS